MMSAMASNGQQQEEEIKRSRPRNRGGINWICVNPQCQITEKRLLQTADRFTAEYYGAKVESSKNKNKKNKNKNKYKVCAQCRQDPGEEKRVMLEKIKSGSPCLPGRRRIAHEDAAAAIITLDDEDSEESSSSSSSEL